MPRRRTGPDPATRTPSRSGSGGAATTRHCSVPPPSASCAGESTPFYLWSHPAHRRIAEHLPDVKLDRAGPRPDRPRVQQLDAPVVGRPRERARLRARLRAPGAADRGRLGAVLALPRPRALRPRSSRTCTGTSTASGCSSCATATSSTSRPGRSTRCAGSWASPTATSTPSRRTTRGRTPSPAGGPRSSGRPSAPAPGSGSSRRRRCGATLSVPLVAQLSTGQAHRPRLSPDARARLLPHFEEDIALLSELTGDDFPVWRSVESRGSFEQRATSSRTPPEVLGRDRQVPPS